MNSNVGKNPPKPPYALEPVYITQTPNEPVILFEGNLQLTLESGEATFGPGQIELKWLPHPDIRFSLSQSQLLPGAINLPDIKLTIPNLKMSCDASLTGTSISNEGIYRGSLKTPVIIGNKGDCNQILFHLPNFFSIVGKFTQNRNSGKSAGRLCLESDNLRVILDKIPIASNLIESLRDQSGFALTYTGALERIDGSLFSFDEAESLLNALHYYLSFTRGFWCGPILVVGRVNDTNVWQLWQYPHLTPWKYVKSWFPQHDKFKCTEINKAFRGFLTKWNDQLWKVPIKHIIHWYIESNIGSGGIEGSIIFIQAALELLSWLYLVEDSATKQFCIKQFNDLKAMEKIQNLLSILGIPASIPPGLTNLCRETSKLGDYDGPQALVKLRNAIIHPKKTDLAPISVDARMEVRELGLWYIEMALLRIFGYEGEYYQRFLGGWPDDVRAKVPWA